MSELEERIVDGVIHTGWVFAGEVVGNPLLGDRESTSMESLRSSGGMEFERGVDGIWEGK